MIHWPGGIEFSELGLEQVGEKISLDVDCAMIIARVVGAHQIEGDLLAPVESKQPADDTPLVERMEKFGRSETSNAWIHDSEVPAVLGMLRSAFEKIDLRGSRGLLYRGLPANAMELLIESFDGYESQRPISSPV